MDSNQRSANFIVVTPHRGDHSLKFEKEIDEISATGGHRFLSPIDVNDVLSPCGRNYRRLRTPAQVRKPLFSKGLAARASSLRVMKTDFVQHFVHLRTAISYSFVQLLYEVLFIKSMAAAPL